MKWRRRAPQLTMYLQSCAPAVGGVNRFGETSAILAPSVDCAAILSARVKTLLGVDHTVVTVTPLSLPIQATRSVAARCVILVVCTSERKELAAKAVAVSPIRRCAGMTDEVASVVRLPSFTTSSFTSEIFPSARSRINVPTSWSTIFPLYGRKVKSSTTAAFTLTKHFKGVLEDIVNASHSSGKVNDGIDESNCIPYATYFLPNRTGTAPPMARSNSTHQIPGCHDGSGLSFCCAVSRCTACRASVFVRQTVSVRMCQRSLMRSLTVVAPSR